MTIRWGILGAGKIASKWAEDLPRAENAMLESVWARDPDKARRFASVHGGRAAASVDELLASETVDAVYVASPHGLHADLARRCLLAGKPVLVEKPFACSRAEAEPVAALARERGVLCVEALWTRFLPSFRAALEVVASGRIGEVRRVVADFGFATPFDPSSRLWDPEQGGGSLLDIGIYPLFLARALLGDPTRVRAEAERAANGVDAACRMELDWGGDAAAALHCSFLEASPGMAVIEGEEGRLILEPPFHVPTTVVVMDAAGVERILPPPGGRGYEHEIRHFGECLDQGLAESPLWSLDETLGLAELLDRVREAAAP